jgi:hypothetical protein
LIIAPYSYPLFLTLLKRSSTHIFVCTRHELSTTTTTTTTKTKPKTKNTKHNTQNSRDELRIDDYSISQTTLEHVFNFFASQQKEETHVSESLVGFQHQDVHPRGGVEAVPSAPLAEAVIASRPAAPVA